MSSLAPSPAGDAVAHVRDVVQRSGSSFYWGMRILPPARRDAMYAVYAFCREVDDIADGSDEAAAKQAGLADWVREIEALYAGRPSRRPTIRALTGPIAAFDLPKAEFLAVIDGMAMDAEANIVAPAMADFELYCRRVAGAVGLLSIRVFGDPSPAAEDFALALGDALQMTNILRDVAEDAAQGRLYLPRELLVRHGVRLGAVAETLAQPGVAAACAELAALAHDRFARADRCLARCDRRALKPALIMRDVYGRLLDRLEARGWRQLSRAVSVSKPAKLMIVARHALF